MQKIISETGLKAAILQLESKQAMEGVILKQQFHNAYESVKPINFIKNIFKEAASSEDIRDNVLNTSVGLAAGYLSKVLFQGISHGPLRKLFGTVLMFGVTNAVAKNPESVKAVAQGLFKIIIKTGGRIHNNNVNGNRVRKPIS